MSSVPLHLNPGLINPWLNKGGVLGFITLGTYFPYWDGFVHGPGPIFVGLRF